MKKLAAFLCAASLAMLLGCSSANDQAVEVLENASEDTASPDSAQTAESDMQNSETANDSTTSEEMPEHDLGIDEAAYLCETYALESAEGLDLISADEFTWLAKNKGSSIVVVADPADERSAAMIAAAQEGVDGKDATVVVYEPARDAGEGSWDDLASRLAEDGVANLDSLEAGTLLIMSKFTVDSDTNPAPINTVVDDPTIASGIVADSTGLSCCGF